MYKIYLVKYKNTRPSRTSAVFVHASIQPKNGVNNISKALQISLLFRLFHWPFVFSAKHKNCKRFISRKKRFKKNEHQVSAAFDSGNGDDDDTPNPRVLRGTYTQTHTMATCSLVFSDYDSMQNIVRNL